MIYILFFISFIVTFYYFNVIRNFLDGWINTNQYTTKEEPSETKVSVVIAAYNEAENIEACISSVMANSYPRELLQIIVVDNGSTDSTFQLLNQSKFSEIVVLQEKQGHKKEALEKGFSVATGDFILCTDADCVVNPLWIQSMVMHHEVHGAEFILGPVAISAYNNLPTRFQAFDMLAMMGVTAGGVKNKSSYLANGANMAFSKKVFDEVGEIPRKDIASGDDVFLLHAFAMRNPAGIYYNRSKQAIVNTKAIKSWKGLVQQRIRWASKATSYVSSRDRNTAAFIFIFCLTILINIILTPFTGGVSFFFALFQLFIKGVLDYFFMERVNEFFRYKHLMKYFLPAFIVHYAYILFSGLAGIIGLNYRWKGKKISV